MKLITDQENGNGFGLFAESFEVSGAGDGRRGTSLSAKCPGILKTREIGD